MLKTVADAGVPVLVFFTTVVVATALTTSASRRIAGQRGTIAAVVGGQFVFLPIVGWLLVTCLNFQPPIERVAGGYNVAGADHP